MTPSSFDWEKEIKQLSQLRLSSASKDIADIFLLPLYISSIIVFFSIGLILIFGITLGSRVFFSGVNQEILNMINQGIMLGSIILGPYLLKSKTERMVFGQSLRESVIELINIYKKGGSIDTETLDTLLKKIEEIQKKAKRIISYSRFSSVFTKKSKENIESLLLLSSTIVQTLLADIGKRLAEIIENQKNTLQKTAQELGANSSRNQIHETLTMQKIRLDRQAQQFEELQKILVKM